MPFLEYHTRLRQFCPSIAPEQAMEFVNNAWRDIREANEEWSFLYAVEYWQAPALISLTGLTVTQFSASVDLGYAGMLLMAGLNNPPATLRQFRAGVSGGPIYSIAALDTLQVSDGAINALATLLTSASGPFDPAHVGRKIRVAGAGAASANLDTTIASYVSPTQVNVTLAASTTVGPSAVVTWGSTLTLDRMYTEDSSTNQGAIVYRIYYSPLSTDFQRLDHLVDPVIGYPFGRVVRPIEILDRFDPRRSSVTQPYYIFYRGYSLTTNLPIYELWPGPTQQRSYPAAIWRLGTEFTGDDDALPPQVPEQLLLMRARFLLYEWAMVNDEDVRRRQSYAAGLQYVRSKYSTEGQPGRPLGLLETTKRRDKSVALKSFNITQRGRGWGDYGWPPTDSRFYQNHGLGAL